MEFEDDECFVIIVEADEKCDNKDSRQVKTEKFEIKEELLDESDTEIPVEKLIEQATLYGECLDVTGVDPLIKTEVEEYIENGVDTFEVIEKLLGKHKKQRHTMLKPWQRKSFIQELRNDCPEAAKNQKVLIKRVVDEMRKIKAPLPPVQYYDIDLAHGFFQCSICGSSSETQPAASRHYQEKHGPRYLICFACGANFRSKTNLYKHEKHCIAPDAVVMLKARALFLGNKGRHRPFLPRRNYVVYRPKPKTFSCELCPAAFRSRISLSSHRNQHRGERPYLCELCHNAYTSPAGLSRHRRRHGEAKFTCDHCQRSFKLKETLVVHMDVHLPEPRFACGECPRRYSQRAALVLHVTRDHRRQPPAHACHICQKRFPRLSNLKNHMKKIHSMLIITRKMFFKELPKLKDTHLKQAKVVYKSDDNLVLNSQTEDFDTPEEMLTSLQNSDGSYVTFVDKEDFVCVNKSEVVEQVLGLNYT